MKKYTDTGKKDTRSGFGAGLLEAGRKNPDIVALAADLVGSVKMDAFAKEFPERFIQCGIAEANMIGAAAGLAITGKVAFVGSFAEFVTGRVYDQVRQEVAYGHTNVKTLILAGNIEVTSEFAPYFIAKNWEVTSSFTMSTNITLTKPFVVNGSVTITGKDNGAYTLTLADVANSIKGSLVLGKVISLAGNATIKSIDGAQLSKASGNTAGTIANTITVTF
jgi:hypothetical protein